MARKTKADSSTSGVSLSLSGVVASELCLIKASSMRLVLTHADDLSGRKHLVPLADWQMIGTQLDGEADSDRSFEAILPLDNMAFLICDLCKEFADILTEMGQLSKESSMDAHLVVDWMQEAARSAARAADTAQIFAVSTNKSP